MMFSVILCVLFVCGVSLVCSKFSECTVVWGFTLLFEVFFYLDGFPRDGFWDVFFSPKISIGF